MEKLAGLIAGFLIIALGMKRKSLTEAGALIALFIGSTIVITGGVIFYLPLFTFFVFSSMLTGLKKTRKQELPVEFEKTGTRDAWQVLANGSVVFVSSILYYIFNCNPVFFLIALCSLSCVTADTWATEIGVLSKKDPVLITTLKKVHRGTSGGISLLGTIATLAGGFLIGLSGLISVKIAELNLPWTGLILILKSILSGAGGSIIDSLVGASIQRQFLCQTCSRGSEKIICRCGKKNIRVRGFSFIGNDMVNFISSMISGIVFAYF